MMKPLNQRSCADLSQALKNLKDLEAFATQESARNPGDGWLIVFAILNNNRKELEAEIKRRRTWQ